MILPKNPRVRKDGTCYVCQGERPEIAVKNADPFCSADCARKHFNVPTPASSGVSTTPIDRLDN